MEDNVAINNVPNVLLLGNGINRAFGDLSWSGVIDGLSTGEFDYNQKWMENFSLNLIPLKFIMIMVRQK